MNNKKIKTKFGTAKPQKRGYYIITSKKEGNNGKLLHRLIWEDFYGCKIPEGYIIHHRNFNKLDNCILNLQLMRDKDHRKLHNTGKSFSDEHKQKLSESHKKKYARIIKCGFRNGKQIYGIRFDGKNMITSFYISKLLDWFSTNYPHTILRIPKYRRN